MIHGIGTISRDLHLEDRVLALASDALDRNTGEGKFIRKARVIDPKIDEVAEPIGRNFHFKLFGDFLCSHDNHFFLTAGAKLQQPCHLERNKAIGEADRLVESKDPSAVNSSMPFQGVLSILPVRLL
jgi:hypothetical protein